MPAQEANQTMDSMTPIYKEKQVKIIQERITQVERQFGDLCQVFGSLGRKLSKMRDTGDKVAKAVLDYSAYERFNATTKSALKDFAEAFAAVQDYRDIEVKRLEAKVIQPLSTYGNICKKTKESLKDAVSALNKENKQRKSLDSAREKNPNNTQRLVNMELERATRDATMQTRRLEDEMDQFERRKLCDLKKILIDFVNIEMIYHAKALELYTEAHASLSSISEDDDLQEFRNSIRHNVIGGRSAFTSGSRTSLNTTGTDGQTTLSGTGRSSVTAKSTPATTPVGARRPASANSTSRKSDKASRDDDDDDEDEENEDYGSEEEEEEEDDDDVRDDDDEDEENSDVDDYARKLNGTRQSQSQSFGTAGSRSSQGSRNSQTPGTSPPKSILRPSSPKV